jgi:hypothetical protein
MRRVLAVVAAFVAACASAPHGEPVVFVAADGYACGAAEGLGCGLALAPVMAEIDRLEGVAECRVAWNGRRFRIVLDRGADGARVANAVAARLEGRFDPDASAANEDVWLNATETIELSRYEATRIAAEHAGEIATELALAPEASRKLESVMLEELTVAFERAHAAGGGVDRLWEQWPDAERRFQARLPSFLTPEQCTRVSAILARSNPTD